MNYMSEGESLKPDCGRECLRKRFFLYLEYRMTVKQPPNTFKVFCADSADMLSGSTDVDCDRKLIP